MTKSLPILGERFHSQEEQEEAERENWAYLRNPSNERLATHKVLTGRRPLEKVCDKVLALIA